MKPIHLFAILTLFSLKANREDDASPTQCLFPNVQVLQRYPNTIEGAASYSVHLIHRVNQLFTLCVDVSRAKSPTDTLVINLTTLLHIYIQQNPNCQHVLNKFFNKNVCIDNLENEVREMVIHAVNCRCLLISFITCFVDGITATPKV